MTPGKLPSRPDDSRRASLATPLVLFTIVACAIAAAGVGAYDASAATLRAQKERELSAIAALKVQELQRWYDERRADAEAIASDPAVVAPLLDPDGSMSAARGRLETWYDALRTQGEYSGIALLDRDGAARVALGVEPEELEADELPRLLGVAARAGPLLAGAHDGALPDPATMNLVAAVVEEDGTVRGGVLLRVDPYHYLYRMLQAWPGPSASAETMLVRREGDSALVLNELRHWPDDPAALRISADDPEDPAALAVSGVTGIVRGVDYRDRPVLAAIAPFADSPWILVTKIDADEALAPIAERRIWVIVAIAALIAATGSAAAFLWRGQSAALERRRFREEAERTSLLRKLEHLAKSALDVIVLADERQRLVEVNDRAVALLGYTREELIGMHVRDLRDPATTSDFAANTSDQERRGSAAFETRYRRKDGTTFPVEVSVRTDLFEGRRWFQAIVRDITARKQAEEALRASEAKFRAAFESASLGVMLVDADGRILESNRAFRRMLGYAEGDPPVADAAELPAPGSEPSTMQLLAQLRSGAVDAVELARRYRRKDGSLADVVLRATALRDAAGAFQYAIALVEDVSEKKLLEAQLLLADRMASVGTLAAGVAHEINNPLAFVLANLDFALADLRGGDAAPEVLRALEEAKAGGARVQAIVRDLKTFSRADDEAKELVDVVPVLRSALGVAANALRHRAQVEVALAPVPKVLASEHRLGQVFLNLLVNAAQAIPDGHPAANGVRVVADTADDGRVRVEISDTGSGIPPEILPRIFDPFFTTKPVGVGTGLGLAICHGIVTGLGGEISVESAVGRGTTFRVLLPAAPRRAADEPRPGRAPPVVRRGRVLVVDDEPLVARAVQRILSQHEVVTCGSAQEALAEIARAGAGFDAVLCDLMMPETTGMELHAALAAAQPEVAARMVFVTGGAFTAVAREFLDRVPNPRVEKPFDAAALRALVARVVAASAAAPAAAARA